jgi:SAM-dependent methyltransferase
MSDSVPDPRPEDPYSRTEYRRVIAWKRRIEREGPFLTRLLERAPDRSVLDVGCGTGEHTAFFSGLDARAVGLDRSETMIAAARDHETESSDRRPSAKFFVGEATAMHETLGSEPPFGLLLCLGNMLPHLLEKEELDSLLAGARRLLAPGGIFLVQLLNYRRLLEQNVRHLPLNFRDSESAEEIIFLRLLQPISEERILFFPTTLALNPDAEEPVVIKSTQRVELRPWTDADLEPAFEEQGFGLERY